MTTGVLFWLLWFVWFLFGGWTYWPRSAPGSFTPFGGHFLVLAMLFLIGWRVFGFPIHSG